MTSLSITIMAHPKRRAHVDAMVDRLDQQVLKAQHDGYDVSMPDVVWDTDGRGAWWCAREAWRRAQGTHHLVLQDDITFCADLPSSVLAAVRARPDHPVSFFLPRNIAEASALGLQWVSCVRFLWSQAVALSRPLIEPMIEWIAENEDGHPFWGTCDDTRMASFFRGMDLRTYVTVPNLVEHVGDVLGSLLGHTNPRSSLYIGDDARGVDVPWEELDALHNDQPFDESWLAETAFDLGIHRDAVRRFRDQTNAAERML